MANMKNTKFYSFLFLISLCLSKFTQILYDTVKRPLGYLVSCQKL